MPLPSAPLRRHPLIVKSMIFHQDESNDKLNGVVGSTSGVEYHRDLYGNAVVVDLKNSNVTG